MLTLGAWIQYELFCNILCFNKFLNFGVKLPEDGVNDAQTCTSKIKLYFYVSDVHSLVLWILH